MSEVRQRRIDLILQELEDLPTLPSIAVRVLEVTSASDSQAGEVVSLIESDPSLTARILRLVHRADLPARGPVSTIERAVMVLGFEAVRSAVLSISVFQTFGEDQANTPKGHFVREEFWKHSVAVACCAELLAQKMLEGGSGGMMRGGQIDPAEAFVCGLLHDVGKVALDVVLPKSFQRVAEAADLLRGNIADLERSIIGLDHNVVGKRLAQRWQLPAAIHDAIWLHGQAPEALPAGVANPALVNVVTLADLLVRQQHLGYSGNYTFTLSAAALSEALGLDAAAVESVSGQLIEQIEPRAAALGLGQASSRELYLQALSQANKELGRVGDQLAQKNQKLAVRAKFFDVLNDFQSILRPDAPIQTVLKAIGQTAVSVLQVPRVCIFSRCDQQAYGQVLVLDGDGPVVYSRLIEIDVEHNEPALRYGGDGPVLSAGEELEWVLSEVSPRLSGMGRYWISLEMEGVAVGGVLWGADKGEAERLGTQARELTAIAGGWSLALRTAQIREESRNLAEQLAEANQRLLSAQGDILRARTLTTIGEVAAGAAHEMNNPLMVISGRSQLLAQQLSDAKQAEWAKQIYESSHRLSEMISELMAFACPQAPAVEQVDVRQLVERVLESVKGQVTLADRIVELSLADLPPVRVDPQQVGDALVEVLSNAVQATEARGGKIEIRAAMDPYSQRIVLSITDNGCGMDESVLKHAFDPFYSYKLAGRRRGMGLARALRWIEAAGGTIRLESRPGHGTSAIVFLPSADAQQMSDSTAQELAAVQMDLQNLHAGTRDVRHSG